MKPYTGAFLLPTQVRDLRGAAAAIAEAKEKFMNCESGISRGCTYVC